MTSFTTPPLPRPATSAAAERAERSALDPRPRRRSRRTTIAVFAGAILVAGCGGGSSDADRTDDDDDEVTEIDESVDTEPTDAPVTTEAAATTAPATTGPPTTSAPPTTVAAATFPGDQEWTEWIAVRRVTSDNGYFGLPPELPALVEARAYWFRCVDESCSTLDFEARLLSDTESVGPPTPAKVADGVMSWATAGNEPCLSTATGQVDGPAESSIVASFGLAATSSPAVWQGVYQLDITTAASDACVAESVGFVADTWVFDPAGVARSDQAVGTWFGEIGTSNGNERAVRACHAAEECELMLRQAIDDPGNPAGATRRFIDVPLTRDADGRWYGVVEYDESCISDLDGMYLAEQGYLTTHEVWLTVYDLGEGSTQRLVAEVDERKVGATHPSLSPELAAACGAFDVAIRFVGLPIDTPTITDWTTPAGVPEPVPAG